MLPLRPLATTAMRASASARPMVTRSVTRMMYTPFRKVATKTTTPDESLEILQQQRAKRPVSPHLQIYELQLTAVMSSFHRITGVALALPLYAFLVGYAGLPMLGYELTSDAIVASFGALPVMAKLPLKFLASMPFTYHAFNGIRHLVWDTTKELSIKGVYRTGYIVLGLALASSSILAII